MSISFSPCGVNIDSGWNWRPFTSNFSCDNAIIVLSLLAIILIDARKGISQQTKRHSLLCMLLGIKGFILDGFPRTVNQAEDLDILLNDNKIDCVLRIKVDEEEIIKRLIDRGRDDDKPEIIKNRFKSYNSETQPLIPFYDKRRLLFNINGMQEIEKVTLDIKKVLGEFWILTCMKPWL